LGVLISDDLIDYGNISQDDFNDFIETYIAPVEVVNVK